MLVYKRIILDTHFYVNNVKKTCSSSKRKIASIQSKYMNVFTQIHQNKQFIENIKYFNVNIKFLNIFEEPNIYLS